MTVPPKKVKAENGSRMKWRKDDEGRVKRGYGSSREDVSLEAEEMKSVK